MKYTGEEKTYIVDFKTASREVTECINAEQLKTICIGLSETNWGNCRLSGDL